MTDRILLEHLLRTVFDRNELVRFLDTLPDGDDMRRCLPGESTSWQVTASAVTDELLRRGYDGWLGFWDALLLARPNQRSSVVETRQHYLPRAAASTTTPSASYPTLTASRWRRRCVSAALVAVTLLGLIIIYHADEAQRQRTWTDVVGRTERIPLLIMPSRRADTPVVIDDHVRVLFQRDHQARDARAHGDFHAALAHLAIAEVAAEALLAGPATTDDDHDQVHLHNLAVIVEAQALVESRVGNDQTARAKRTRVTTLREQAVRNRHGDPTYSVQLAQLLRREVVVDAANHDLAHAQQTADNATRVLEHASGASSDARVQHELRDMQAMRDSLARLPVDWEPGPGDLDHQYRTQLRTAVSCHSLLERGEAALTRGDVLTAEDTFDEALPACPTTDEYAALLATWTGAALCMQALGSDDAEVRQQLLTIAESAAPPVDGELPAWARRSWQRAWDRLTDCRADTSLALHAPVVRKAGDAG